MRGGASQTACDAGEALGGSWAPNDVIYFALGNCSGLWQVSANGGTPQPFTTFFKKAEISHRWPQVLPGGQAVLFRYRTGPGADEHQVQVQRVLTVNGAYWRREKQATTFRRVILSTSRDMTGTLVAIPFDLTRLRNGGGSAGRRGRGNPGRWRGRALHGVRERVVGVSWRAAPATKIEHWCGWIEMGKPNRWRHQVVRTKHRGCRRDG